MNRVERRIEEFRNCSKEELEENLKLNKESQKLISDEIDNLIKVKNQLGQSCNDITINGLDQLYYKFCDEYVQYQINIEAIEKCLHS